MWWSSVQTPVQNTGPKLFRENRELEMTAHFNVANILEIQFPKNSNEATVFMKGVSREGTTNSIVVSKDAAETLAEELRDYHSGPKINRGLGDGTANEIEVDAHLSHSIIPAEYINVILERFEGDKPIVEVQAQSGNNYTVIPEKSPVQALRLRK